MAKLLVKPTVTVWDRLYDTQLGEFPGAAAKSGVEFQVQNGQDGSGTVVVHRTHPDAVHLQPGNILRFAIGGDVVHACRIQGRRQKTKAAKKPDELITVSAPGLASWLQYALVWPVDGLNRWSPDTRLMNWTAPPPQYDDSIAGWVDAYEIKRQGDTTGEYDGCPDPWPSTPVGGVDPRDAMWIAPQAPTGGTPPQPVGKSPIRAPVFTVADDATNIRIFTASDDGYVGFLQGMRFGGRTLAFMFEKAEVFNITVDAGDYQLAYELENIFRPSASTNITGLIYAVARLNTAGDEILEWLLLSDGTARAYPYPTSPLGMTPGRIWRIFQQEWTDRGGDPFTLSFDDDVDTDGDPWEIVDLGVPVRSPLSVVMKKLTELGTSWRFGPEALRLDGWQKRGTDRSRSIIWTHVESVDHAVDGPTMNAALAQYADGRWRASNDDASIADWGRLEGGPEFGGASSELAADQHIDAGFAKTAQPVEQGTSTIRIEAGSVPLVDADIGDLVSVTGDDGEVSVGKLDRVTYTTDTNGFLRAKVDV